jgi:hypothetical protein
MFSTDTLGWLTQFAISFGVFQVDFVSNSAIPVSTSTAAAYLDTLGSKPAATLVRARNSRRFIAGMGRNKLD